MKTTKELQQENSSLKAAIWEKNEIISDSIYNLQHFKNYAANNVKDSGISETYINGLVEQLSAAI
jgi:hypothetical protein